MSATSASGSVVQIQNNSGSGLVPSRRRPTFAHQFNVTPLSRLNSRLKSSSCSVSKRSNVLENKFLGTRLRGCGSERLHLWQSDGPGRSPKLRVVVRSALSQVPEKPLGLYDPSFDKDSCGVGFVAELSGESSRKTVGIEFGMFGFFGQTYLFSYENEGNGEKLNYEYGLN